MNGFQTKVHYPYDLFSLKENAGMRSEIWFFEQIRFSATGKTSPSVMPA
jgi:hypothetical protein